VIAFMLTGSKAPLVLIVGAALAGWLGTLCLINIVRYTRIKEDSALGLILSVFFGLGLMLLTFLQRSPDAGKAGLNTFLFGQAATLLERDVVMMAIVGGLALLIMALLWKEFKLLSFDRNFGSSLGFPMQVLDVILMSLFVIAIVIGLQAVGVILMSAMLVAPAAAARQWTDRLSIMVLLAAAFGAISGVAGALISSLGRNLSTGPVVVLCISTLVMTSLLLAPNRGLIWTWVRRLRNRRRLRLKPVLCDLYALANQHTDPYYPHHIETLRTTSGGGGVRWTLTILEELGWVQRMNQTHWALTPNGYSEAKRLTMDDGIHKT
jgi:manganese/zinc/iron transport system permease protein